METQQSRKGGKIRAFDPDEENTTSKVPKILQKQGDRFSKNAKIVPRSMAKEGDNRRATHSHSNNYGTSVSNTNWRQTLCWQIQTKHGTWA